MKAMILAAGEGRRMLPLTQHTPKPLLKVKGKSLIEHQIYSLQGAGICDIIINVAYQGEQIMAALGDGSRYGVDINYSIEDKPLETGGALLKAIPMLGDEPFLLVNADIYTDYDFACFVNKEMNSMQGHLVLVDNPPHNSTGDFRLSESRHVELNRSERGYTFAGISLLHPNLITRYPQKRAFFALREVFDYAIARGQLSGEHFQGAWVDVGTPERLAQLQ